MALLFFGKLFIAVGLCLQAYLLFANPSVSQNFDATATTMLSSCDCLPPEVSALLKQHLRMIVVGLLGLSSLMIVTKSAFIKFLVIIGYVTLCYIRHYPLKQIPALTDYGFYENVAIVGGLIYLMGSDMSVQAPKPKVKKQ